PASSKRCGLCWREGRRSPTESSARSAAGSRRCVLIRVRGPVGQGFGSGNGVIVALIGLDDAILEDDRARAVGGDIRLVRNEDNGRPGLVETLQDSHDLDTGA